MFGNPFDDNLIAMLAPLVRRALETHGLGESVTVHEGKTLLVMEGPAFSTRAESNWYRAAGADVRGFSVPSIAASATTHDGSARETRTDG